MRPIWVCIIIYISAWEFRFMNYLLFLIENQIQFYSISTGTLFSFSFNQNRSNVNHFRIKSNRLFQSYFAIKWNLIKAFRLSNLFTLKSYVVVVVLDGKRSKLQPYMHREKDTKEIPFINSFHRPNLPFPILFF